MPKNQEITSSDFYCTKCGSRGIPIARSTGKEREAGHLKKLYCLHCKDEINHAEVRNFGNYTYEDFKLEFELGRFVDGVRIPINECLNCKNIECKYNINGKCWNCNHSFICGHRVIEEILQEKGE